MVLCSSVGRSRAAYLSRGEAKLSRGEAKLSRVQRNSVGCSIAQLG
jgi:hypothetical protein